MSQHTLQLIRLEQLAQGTGYLLRTHDGYEVMAVDKLLSDSHDSIVRRKASISLSSGCAVGCRYCFTQGKPYRPLAVQEIVEQADIVTALPCAAYDELKISMKQMGDPLMNPANTLGALSALSCRYDAGYVVSTSGPDINLWFFRELKKLRDDGMQIKLQFSCHTTSNLDRRKLSPVLPMLTLEEIAHFAHQWYDGRERATLNFVPLAGYELSAMQLARIFEPDKVFVKISFLDRNVKNCSFEDADKKAANVFAKELAECGFDQAYRLPASAYLPNNARAQLVAAVE
jgi:adenine C2-methylase RlmN of 23S rRNA A2503 and tRNA A37